MLKMKSPVTGHEHYISNWNIQMYSMQETLRVVILWEFSVHLFPLYYLKFIYTQVCFVFIV